MRELVKVSIAAERRGFEGDALRELRFRGDLTRKDALRAGDEQDVVERESFLGEALPTRLTCDGV